MRKELISIQVLLTLCVVVLSVAASAALAQGADDLIVIGKKRQIESKILEETRALWISTPASYDVLEESYPVLYLLDGDINFHHTTGTVGFLAANGRIPEMLVVAVPTTINRRRDLTPPSQLAQARPR